MRVTLTKVPMAWLAPLPVLVFSLACGGGGGTPNPTPPPQATAPVITTQPVRQDVIAGQTLTLSVAATGSGPLGHQWKMNGPAIPGANAAAYTVASADAGQNGRYFSITVSNAAGSVTSDSVFVTVLLGPIIEAQPADQSVAVGQSATLSVSIPRSTSYQWQRNQQDIPGATSSSYTLTNPPLSNDGAAFRCQGSNAAGSATTSSAKLSVAAAGSPVAISAFTASSASVNLGESIILNWTVIGTPSALTLNGANVPEKSSITTVLRKRQTYMLTVSGQNSDAKSLEVMAKGFDLLAGSLSPGEARWPGQCHPVQRVSMRRGRYCRESLCGGHQAPPDPEGHSARCGFDLRQRPHQARGRVRRFLQPLHPQNHDRRPSLD